jgi:hypothetical protein
VKSNANTGIKRGIVRGLKKRSKERLENAVQMDVTSKWNAVSK